MTVCRFYLQGHCKFGDRCKNEHPSRGSSDPNRNPFAPLQESSGNRPSTNAGRGSSSREPQAFPYSISKSNLTNDLLNERPQWILSSYAPGRDAPTQLFGGYPREQSFEEMRVRHYLLSAQGKREEAQQEAQILFNNAERQIKNALEDVDGAIRYVVEGGNQHPNRVDICRSKGGLTQQESAPTAISQAPSLGTSSALPTYGQPSAPLASTSVLDKAPSSNFGQPSFGQPSFSQTPRFGQSSAQIAQPAPAIGQAKEATSIFGQPSTTASNPFSNPQTTSNPFARTSQTLSAPPVHQNLPAAINPFSSSNTPSFLGQAQAKSNSPNPFARSDPAPTNAAFGQSSRPQVRADSSRNTSAQIQKDTQGKIRSWNGKSVRYLDNEPCYQGADGNWHRIWFADGEPTFVNSSSLPDSAYDHTTKENYDHLRQTGMFKNGVLPILPPKRDWCNWNL